MILLRDDPVDISRYLPKFLAKDRVMFRALLACSAQHEKQRLLLDDLSNQFLVQTATWGLAEWERLVDITPPGGADIASRRAAVLLKLRKPPSVTSGFLEKLINQYIADKSGTVTDHPETYSADFDIPLLDKENLAGLTRDVRVYIPAHIGPVYKAHTIASAENRIAMLKSTVKIVDVYPAAVEQIKPESTYYVALAMTTTEELTLQIGGI